MNRGVLNNSRSPYTQKKKRIALAVMAALSAAPIVANAAPAGDEFQVNSYTTSFQNAPAIAIDQDGDFVVTWRSYTQDGNSFGIYGQRYDALGNMQGTEFQVNTYTTDSQSLPAIAMDQDGDFVVTWASIGQDGSLSGVYGQLFLADGTRFGPAFQVNTYTTSNQNTPVVAMDADGDFVVTWASSGQDGSSYGIFGQRFDANGNKQGGEFQVNSYTTGIQSSPAIAMDQDGDFVVTWRSAGQDGSYDGIFAQRFDALGNPQGGEIQVNSYTTDNQNFPAIIVDRDGDFVVTWSSNIQDGSSFGVYARRFASNGSPQGEEFRVNTYTTNNQSVPAMALNQDGDFVVTWVSQGQDGSDFGIYGQRFDAMGNPRGVEFQVNTYTTFTQFSPDVAMDQDGDFVVTWNSYFQDNGDYGVYGRRYSLSPLADFNKDHYADIFWRQGVTGQNTIWNMQGFDRLGASSQQTVATSWRVGGIGDINGDGIQDVVWRNTTTGANLGWLFQLDGSKVNASLPSLSNTDWEMQGLGDIDGNGHQDIIWRNTNDGRNAAWRIDALGGTLNATTGNLNTVGDLNWNIEGIGDVDGDQKADLIWRNQNDGRNTVWLMDDLTSDSYALPKAALHWDMAGVGDLNNDGSYDIVWRDDLFGANAVWLLNGPTVLDAELILSIVDPAWQVEQVADHSGDGNADILWRNQNDGRNVIFNMNGTRVSFFNQTLTISNTNWTVQPDD